MRYNIFFILPKYQHYRVDTIQGVDPTTCIFLTNIIPFKLFPYSCLPCDFLTLQGVEVESGELESVHADIRALRENLGLSPSSDMNLSNNAIPTSSSTCAQRVEIGKNKMHENASLSVSDLTGGDVECSEVKEENVSGDSDSTGNSSLDGSSINNFDENQFSEELAMTFDGFDFNFFTPPILLLVDELAFLERDLNLLSARTAAQRHVQVLNSFVLEHRNMDC